MLLLLPLILLLLLSLLSSVVSIHWLCFIQSQSANMTQAYEQADEEVKTKRHDLEQIHGRMRQLQKEVDSLKQSKANVEADLHSITDSLRGELMTSHCVFY